MGFNPGMHHRRSIRLQEYDYSQNGYYYVTICTEHFIKYFGEIKSGKMQLSKIGRIVEQCWYEIPRHFYNVILGEMVIMPNHMHGIIIIDNPRGVPCRGVACNAPTNISPKPKSLPTIIRSFKSAVSNICHKNNFTYFQWQRNYYERIIRNENELYIKRRYIINNPIKWEFDKNNFI